MNPYVVIRGGGIAGQVLQKELTLRGISSRIEERSSFPRDKVCGGILQADSWDYLNSIFSIQTPVKKIKTLENFWGRKKISSVNFPREMVYVPRLVLDQALYLNNTSSASSANTKQIAVDASGAEEASGEWIGFQSRSGPVEAMRMYYGREIYLGVTPTLETNSHAAFIVRRSYFKNTEDLKQKIQRDFGVEMKTPLKGTGRIHYGYSSKDLAVGDAKLTTYPFLGFGMKHAILSARLLAGLIAENKEEDYDRIHRRCFQPFHHASWMAHSLNASSFRFLGRPLLQSPRFFQAAYRWLHRSPARA